MMSSASSGVLMSPAPDPDDATFFDGTAHVDIQAVEPEFTHHVGGLVKQEGIFAVQLATIGRCPSVYRNGSQPMTRP